MRRFPRRLTALTLLIGGAAIAAPPASAATSVAYLDSNEVWVSSTDGAQKIRLSAGEGDWREVSQNPQGWIVGVRRESGKIPQLSTFRVWNPQGGVAFQGPLATKQGGSSHAFPLGLNVTADGRGLVYGYSIFTYLTFPNTSLETGFFVLPSETTVSPVLGPLANTAVQWVALGPDDRVVGTSGEREIAIQRAGGLGVTDFDPWLGLSTNPPTYGYDEIDVSGDGTVVVAEVQDDQNGADDPGLISVAKAASFGGDYVDDCFLDIPPTSKPRHPTVSPDASTIAWQDPAGIRVAGIPNLRTGGPSTCELTRPASTLTATGTFPSLGGFDVAAYVAAKNPVPTPTPPAGSGGAAGTGGGTGTPTPTPAPITVTVPTSAAPPKVSSATSSASLKVTSSAAGAAKLTLTILPKALGLKGKTPIVLATGTGDVVAGKTSSLKLKLTPRGKALKKKLKGKKATLTVSVGGSSTTVTIKLA